MTENDQDDWTVSRSFRLPALRSAEDGQRLTAALSNLPGVRTLQPDVAGHRLQLRYRVTETDYRSIAQALSAAGFSPADNGWRRFLAGWYQNLDLNARENAAAPPPACCNKPPAARKR